MTLNTNGFILSGYSNKESLTNEIINNINRVVKSVRRKNKDVKIVLANIIPIQGEPEKVNFLNQKSPSMQECIQNANHLLF